MNAGVNHSCIFSIKFKNGFKNQIITDCFTF